MVFLPDFELADDSDRPTDDAVSCRIGAFFAFFPFVGGVSEVAMVEDVPCREEWASFPFGLGSPPESAPAAVDVSLCFWRCDFREGAPAPDPAAIGKATGSSTMTLG